MNRKRFLAFLLAALTLVGCLPMALFAAEGETGTESPTFTSPTRQEIIDAVGESDFFLDETFDSLTKIEGHATSSDKNAGTYGGAHAMYVSMTNSLNSLHLVTNGSGNAVQYKASTVTEEFPNKESYLDFSIKDYYGNNTNICDPMYEYRNRPFVVSLDVKLGEQIISGGLINVFTRVLGYNDSLSFVKVDSAGNLTNERNKIVGQLSATEFTNVAVYVDIPTWRYYIYINGEVVDYLGYDIPYNNTKYSGKTYVHDGVTYTTEINDYFMNGIRIMQVKNGENATSNMVTADSYTFDNIRIYYTKRDIGFIGKIESVYEATELGTFSGNDTYQLTGNSRYEEALSSRNDSFGRTVNFGTPKDISAYDMIALDIYNPGGVYNKTDFLIVYGQTNRYYDLVYLGEEGSTPTSADQFRLKNELTYTTKTNGTDTKISAGSMQTVDGTQTISGGRTIYSYVEGEETVYRLRTYIYGNSKEYRLDYLDEGWNTIYIPITDSSYFKSCDLVQVNFSGWNANTWRSWNNPAVYTWLTYKDESNKKENNYAQFLKGLRTTEDAELRDENAYCDVRMSNLRLLKKTDTYTNTVAGGWDGTEGVVGSKYQDKVTHAYLTGVQIIDGVWYDFGTDGVCLGKLNGFSSDTKLKDGTNVRRLFKDGKILFGAVKYNTMTVPTNPETGKVDETGITDSNIFKVEMRLSLYDEISAQFRISKAYLSSLGYNGLRSYWVDAGEIKVNISHSDAEYIYFTSERISPDMIGKDIVIKSKFENDALPDGIYARYTMRISIADYCYSALASDKVTPEEKNLIKSTLNYAAAAQKWVASENNTTVADADLVTNGVDTSGLTQATVNSTGDTQTTVGDAEILAVAVGLNNGIRLRVNAKSDAMKLVVTDLNGKETVINGSSFVDSDKAGEYFVYFSGASAAQLRKLYKFELYDANGVPSDTITNYSFETYAYNALNPSEGETPSAELKALVQAMMTYGKYAYDFANGGN